MEPIRHRARTELRIELRDRRLKQRHRVLAAVDGAVASLDELQRAASAYRPEVDVLRARLLESHGLWDEAESVWTGLTLLYPGRDELLHQALRLRAKSLVRAP